ncbi:DUF5682 family protein [Psychrobacter glacincola]|uniref:DUF5682 family protein n=1 Tax=Psychrobacter glacincola TaxID=56810 RepID=UPI0039B0631F
MENRLPARLITALAQLKALNELGITLLPVRHHSPACAFATQQALSQLQPADILIEAPASFNDLLLDLQHPDNKPPLAVLCQTQASTIVNDSEQESETSNEISSEDDKDSKKKKGHKRIYSAYFPFCDYSPEWVAMRFKSTNSLGKLPHVECIDLPWSQQVEHRERVNSEQTWETQSLQQERYLAHSQYIKALADKLHCRDHDEVWEHLFELDSTLELREWQTFFYKVLVWCAMSRLDYEKDVLESESALVREQYMVKCIVARYHFHRDEGSNSKINSIAKKPEIVVVTGGFHTLALIELLHEQLIEQPNKQAVKTVKNKVDAEINLPASAINTTPDESWLIRYSFDRLDALNGYASGMPSPAFYQVCWEQRLAFDNSAKLESESIFQVAKTYNSNSNNNVSNKINNEGNDQNLNAKESESQARQRLVIDFLSIFSQQLRQEKISLSNFITVKTASEQAIRLAELRGHQLIGRFDVMDACYSSFLKGSSDNGTQSFHRLLHEQLGGSQLGQVISTGSTPPLLAQVYDLIKSNRFKLDDTLSKTAKLDVLRNANHRQRSCFLHLLAFLDVGFARRLSGPDFLHGGQLHLLFEEWAYAWTPQIEARLIELSEEGSDIYQLAIQRLLKQREHFDEQAQKQSSAQLIGLLIQASMMGLTEQIDNLFEEVKDILPHDPDLGSVLACGQHLMYLWTGKRFLQLQDDQQLIDLIAQIPVTSLFLLSQLQTPNDDQVRGILAQILSLRNLLKQMNLVLRVTTKMVDTAAHLHPINNINSDAVQDFQNDSDLLSQYHITLNRLLPDWQDIDLLLGAVHALSFIDDISNESQLSDQLQLHFGVGANAEQAVAYLSGMMEAVPTLFLHHQAMTQMLDRLVSQWDKETFIALLPDLRLAFTALKPMQTNELAQQVATLHGVFSTEVTQFQGQISESDMLKGLALNQQLEQVLTERGLIGWSGS